MERPLELRFKNVNKTPDIEQLIREKAAKLERFCDYIIGCRVAVEREHKYESSGNPYRVQIALTVPPEHELIVDKQPQDLHQSLENVIINAFSAMERQLKELVERQQKKVKRREQAIAFVVKILKEEGYGFLKTEDNREIYFHQNSVVDDDFDRLEVGTQVRFVAQEGLKGPQASTVKIIDKPGVRTGENEEEVPVPPGWRQTD